MVISQILSYLTFTAVYFFILETLFHLASRSTHILGFFPHLSTICYQSLVPLHILTCKHLVSCGSVVEFMYIIHSLSHTHTHIYIYTHTHVCIHFLDECISCFWVSFIHWWLLSFYLRSVTFLNSKLIALTTSPNFSLFSNKLLTFNMTNSKAPYLVSQNCSLHTLSHQYMRTLSFLLANQNA